MKKKYELSQWSVGEFSCFTCDIGSYGEGWQSKFVKILDNDKAENTSQLEQYRKNIKNDIIKSEKELKELIKVGVLILV